MQYINSSIAVFSNEVSAGRDAQNVARNFWLHSHVNCDVSAPVAIKNVSSCGRIGPQKSSSRQVPHRQVVLTIAKRLRVFFRYDRRLLGDLAACAWRAIRLYFRVYYDEVNLFYRAPSVSSLPRANF